MITRSRLLRSTAMFAVAALASGGTGIARSAFAQSTQQVTVDGARKVLADLRHDKAFGSAGDLIRRAKGVLIVPRLIKGGFIVGGEGGNGVLMVRRRTGWSDPAFYAIGAASFGLQAGLEQSELILLVMSEKGLNGIMQDQFKIGAQAGITVVTLGSGVEGALSGANLPDIVVWSSTTGLYGGLTIDGSVIRSQPSMDAAYYGRPMRTHDVLFGSQNAAQAAALRREIAAIG